MSILNISSNEDNWKIILQKINIRQYCQYCKKSECFNDCKLFEKWLMLINSNQLIDDKQFNTYKDFLYREALLKLIIIGNQSYLEFKLLFLEFKLLDKYKFEWIYKRILNHYNNPQNYMCYNVAQYIFNYYYNSIGYIWTLEIKLKDELLLNSTDIIISKKNINNENNNENININENNNENINENNNENNNENENNGIFIELNDNMININNLNNNKNIINDIFNIIHNMTDNFFLANNLINNNDNNENDNNDDEENFNEEENYDEKYLKKILNNIII